MKFICLLILLVSFSFLSYAQVKIGANPNTIEPSAVLDLESTTKGLLPPRMTEAQMNAIASPAAGLIVYCTDCDPAKLYFFDGTDWIPVCCDAQSSASVSANCNANGFAGNFVSGSSLSGTSFSVTITNNSFSQVIINFSAGDLQLAGITGLAVGAPTGSPALSSGNATLNAGGSVTVTYPITGTPGSCGTLTGTWSKLALNCVKTVSVAPNFVLPASNIVFTDADLTSFTANWTAQPGATGYTIEYATTNNGPWTPFPSNPYTGTSASITGLSGSPVYHIRYTIVGGACAGAQTSASVSNVSANCNANGFAGNFVSGSSLSGTSFSVTITNNSLNAAVINFAAGDLQLAGITGMAVGTPTGSPALASGNATLNAGGSVTVTYPITGTPGSCGTLTGSWTKLALSCVKTVFVAPSLALPASNFVFAGSNLTSFTANWAAQPGATGYTIEYATTNNGPWTPFPSNPYTGTSASITGLSGSPVYHIRYTIIGGACAGAVATNVTCQNDLNIGTGDVAQMMYPYSGTYNTFNYSWCAREVTQAGYTWLDRNLGAYRVATSSTDAQSYGDLFQWGRKNDGHAKRVQRSGQAAEEGNTSQGVMVNGTTATKADVPTNALFIIESNSPYDWRVNPNSGLWSGVGAVNNPCPTGYRVPTSSELQTLNNSFSPITSVGAFSSPVKMPVAGARNVNGSLFAAYTEGFYWTSSGTTRLYISSGGNNTTLLSSNYGFLVRCLKD